MERYLWTVVCVMAACIAAASVSEAPAQINQAGLLRKMPRELLDKAGGAYPDKDGLVGHNRGGFKAAAFQRGATLKLAVAAAQGDARRAADCWRAVETTFARQTAEGHFGDTPSSVAFWLCELCRSLLVVQQSPLAKEYERPIALLLPKIKKAADWLATKQEVLFKVDGRTPNRLLFDAEAFGLSGVLLKDERLVAIAKQFLARAMKLYRDEDGVFLEHGGGDSSYQAVCLLRLQEILPYFPDKQLDRAVAKGVRWELGRIAADGTVSTEGNTRVKPGGEKYLGVEKQVNLGEITLALLYFHARTGDADALAAVRRIHARHAKPR